VENKENDVDVPSGQPVARPSIKLGPRMDFATKPAVFNDCQLLLRRIKETRSVMKDGNRHILIYSTFTGQCHHPTVKRTTDLTGLSS
jgi:hypothetical protein